MASCTSGSFHYGQPSFCGADPSYTLPEATSTYGSCGSSGQVSPCKAFSTSRAQERTDLIMSTQPARQAPEDAKPKPLAIGDIQQKNDNRQNSFKRKSENDDDSEDRSKQQPGPAPSATPPPPPPPSEPPKGHQAQLHLPFNFTMRLERTQQGVILESRTAWVTTLANALDTFVPAYLEMHRESLERGSLRVRQNPQSFWPDDTPILATGIPFGGTLWVVELPGTKTDKAERAKDIKPVNGTDTPQNTKQKISAAGFVGSNENQGNGERVVVTNTPADCASVVKLEQHDASKFKYKYGYSLPVVLTRQMADYVLVMRLLSVSMAFAHEDGVPVVNTDPADCHSDYWTCAMSNSHSVKGFPPNELQVGVINNQQLRISAECDLEKILIPHSYGSTSAASYKLLLQASTINNVNAITQSIGCVITGMPVDFGSLAQQSRCEPLLYKFGHSTPVVQQALTRRVAEEMPPQGGNMMLIARANMQFINQSGITSVGLKGTDILLVVTQVDKLLSASTIINVYTLSMASALSIDCGGGASLVELARYDALSFVRNYVFHKAITRQLVYNALDYNPNDISSAEGANSTNGAQAAPQSGDFCVKAKLPSSGISMSV